MWWPAPDGTVDIIAMTIIPAISKIQSVYWWNILKIKNKLLDNQFHRKMEIVISCSLLIFYYTCASVRNDVVALVSIPSFKVVFSGGWIVIFGLGGLGGR